MESDVGYIKKSRVVQVAIQLFIIALIVFIFVFYYVTHGIVESVLQGVWVITENDTPINKMMVIKGSKVAIIESVSPTEDKLVSLDENAKFSINPFRFLNNLSVSYKGSTKLELDYIKSKKIKFRLYPTSGLLMISDGPKVLYRMVRDNAYSLNNLSSYTF